VDSDSCAAPVTTLARKLSSSNSRARENLNTEIPPAKLFCIETEERLRIIWTTGCDVVRAESHACDVLHSITALHTSTIERVALGFYTNLIMSAPTPSSLNTPSKPLPHAPTWMNCAHRFGDGSLARSFCTASSSAYATASASMVSFDMRPS
jgi:hypothetical protein